MEFLELRIHGVSGTPPESLLGVKEVGEPIAGDGFVRFVRPLNPEDGTLQDRHGRPGQLEGMSWGRLTSGSVFYATWLLLLPFAIMNLAYWARSWDAENRSTALYRWVVRMLGLGLTATIVFTFASASMDQLAWQCLVRDGDACRSVHGWLGLTEHWSTGQTLVVAALAPAVVLLFLGFLSHRATLRYEAFPGELGKGEDGVKDPHLFSQLMWQGEAMVTRLRALHIATGLATIAIMLAVGVRDLDGASRPLAQIAQWVAIAAVAECLALATPSAGIRWSEGSPASARAGSLLILLAAAALALAAVAAWGVRVSGPALPEYLQGLINAGHVLTVTQIGLLFVLIIIITVGRWRARRTPNEVATAEAAVWGYMGVLLAALSVLFGFTYSAAVAVRVSSLLSGTVQGGACEQCVTSVVETKYVPAFAIAAAAAALFAAMMVLLVAGHALLIRLRRSRYVKQVMEEYASDPVIQRLATGPGDPVGRASTDPRVLRAIRPRALADLVSVHRLAYVLMIAFVIGTVSGLYAAWLAVTSAGPSATSNDLGLSTPVPQSWQSIVTQIGSWVVVAFATGLLALGVLAWRKETPRRIVGIIWDVVSFWPRAAHPLAPPCYAERAVPQLVSRLQYLIGSDPDGPQRLVLAAHSQGSVLSAAALAQLRRLADIRDRNEKDVTEQIALLTVGSPLMRLYAGVFPRIFRPARLRQLSVAAPLRWTNLWRPTDPIGGTLGQVPRPGASQAMTPRQRGQEAVLPYADRPEDEPGDRRLRDPVQLGLVPARSTYAPVRGHLGYPDDPTYAWSRDNLIDLLPDRSDRGSSGPVPGDAAAPSDTRGRGPLRRWRALWSRRRR